MTDPTADFITKALNAHGIFFKKAVRELLEEHRVRILGEEYPVPYLQGASIDLLAEYGRGAGRIILPIECKRAYAAMKRWVFFKDPERCVKFMYAIKGQELRFADTRTYLSVQFSDRVCLEGVEINTGNEKMDPYKAASPDRIWEAAFQACKGSQGFLVQEMRERQQHADSSDAVMGVLPLLVTTAPLSICRVGDRSVDIASGNHLDNAIMEDVDWLVLGYPFTPSAGLGAERLQTTPDEYTGPKERGFHLKEGITIVRAGYLPKFIELLADVESATSGMFRS